MTRPIAGASLSPVFIAAVLAVLSSAAAGSPPPARPDPVPAPIAGPASEIRARALELAAQMRGLPWGPARRELESRVVSLKREYLARAREDGSDTKPLSSELSAPEAIGDWVCDPATNTQVCTAVHDQTSVSVIADGAGGAFVAWSDFRSGSNFDVYAHHLVAGSGVDPAWPVDGVAVCTVSGDQKYPRLISDGSGGALVVWYDSRSGNDDVYAQHLLASGSLDPAWPVSGRALCIAVGDQRYVSGVSDGAGGAVVVWSDRRSGAFDVYAQHVLATGSVDPGWPVNGRALTTASGDQLASLAVSDGAGGAIAVWDDYRYGDADVFAQRVQASGVVDPTWPAGGLAVCSYAWDQDYSWPVSDGAGGFFVTWEDDRFGDADVYGHHVLANGVKDPNWPWNGLAICSKGDDQRYPSPFAESMSAFYVAWEDSVGGQVDIYAQRILVSGTVDPAWPGGGLPVCTASGDQQNPILVTDGSGGALISWDDERGADADLYVHHLLPGGSVDLGWPFQGALLCNAPGDQAWRKMAPDGGGGAVAAWMDWRHGAGDIDIYATRIGPDGKLDDGLEDNDLCATAVEPDLGIHLGLFVYDDDSDWYRISAQRGARIIAELGFTHAEGDIDMALYTSCGGALVAVSDGVGNGEYLEYDNLGPAADYYLRVYLYSGSCNDYDMQLAVVGTSNLNAQATPSGWSSPIVPRNSPDAGPGSVVLPPFLNGNEPTTYLNWGVVQEGPNHLPGWSAALWLDGEEPLGHIEVPDDNPPDLYSLLNQGPRTVRGGRHTLICLADDAGHVLETSEDDNEWSAQWVWSPLEVWKDTPLFRPRPPQLASPFPFNCDGLRYAPAEDLAWVTAIAPLDPDDDYDLYVYDDYGNSLEGFAHDIAGSVWGDNGTDFVVGHHQGTPPVVYPGLVTWAAFAGDECLVDQSDSQGRVGPGEALFGEQVLVSGRLANVYEGEFSAGVTYHIVLRRLVGASDLGFQVFPAVAGDVWGRGDVGHAASLEVNADLDTLAYTPEGSGRHPIVVYRTTGTGAAGGGVAYELQWSTQALVDAGDASAGAHRLAFHGAAPNPMAGGTRVRFELAERGPVRLAVYDLRGRRIRSLLAGVAEAGEHSVSWDGRSDSGRRVGSGIYWVLMETAGRVFSERLAVVR